MCSCLGCIFHVGHLHPPSPSTPILLPSPPYRLTALPTPAQRKLRRNRISTRVGDVATKADQWQRRKRRDKRHTRVPASFAAEIWHWVFWNAGGANGDAACLRGRVLFAFGITLRIRTTYGNEGESFVSVGLWMRTHLRVSLPPVHVFVPGIWDAAGVRMRVVHRLPFEFRCSGVAATPCIQPSIHRAESRRTARARAPPHSGFWKLEVSN